MAQQRTPKGTSSGGQFSGTDHAESELTLDATVVERDFGVPVDVVDGVEHYVYKDGSEEWMVDHQPHRLDGPARIQPGVYEQWWRDGRFHRDGGPAIIGADGTREWYQHGLHHRDGGPAIESDGGGETWMQHGLRHRSDGPAVIAPDGTRTWWKNGKRIDPPPVEETQR